MSQHDGGRVEERGDRGERTRQAVTVGLALTANLSLQAGMFAIRARRKMATEKDFLEAVEKVVRAGSKFSSTALYANYN